MTRFARFLLSFVVAGLCFLGCAADRLGVVDLGPAVVVVVAIIGIVALLTTIQEF